MHLSRKLCAGCPVVRAPRQELGSPPEGEFSQHKRRFASTLGARIVLADDNTDMRDYLRELLQPYYHVEAVPDGEAALEAIRSRAHARSGRRCCCATS